MNNYLHNNKKRGAALLIFLIFSLVASVALTFLVSQSIYADLVSYRVLGNSKAVYRAALSANEDMAYRYLNSLTPDSTETVTINGVGVTSIVDFNGLTDTYIITATASNNNLVRRAQIILTLTNGITFSYGMQAGQGGIEMRNSSSIEGNVHANGPISATGNTINGDVISADSTGLIDDVVITGSAYANTIRDSSVIGGAYYQTLINTSAGSMHPGSPNMATASFPISDEVIDGWKAEAEAGGVHSGPCPFTINSDRPLGPIKIPCNLTISGNNTDVYLNGPVWVEGNLSFSTGPNIHIDPSLPDTIIPMIADNPANRITSSQVAVNQNTEFNGAAGVSHVLVISMNEDEALNSGPNVAIAGGQSGSGDLILYAPRGRATLGNNGSLTELTAYTIELQNSVEVIFDTGLINPNFTGGPSASFAISSWREVE